ncbi:hypothetical protein EV647_2752 [Kribbella sp. VKM Ac-2566]|nr:hypothetical protein EV647_2752 [Kribbella sp. VKM Ac-2566]
MFEWTPILTFTRRRLGLLEWFDEHLQPVAFVEDPKQIGIAIVSPGLRLRVDRDSMIITSAATEPSIDLLEPAIEGVIEILQPKDMTETFCTSLWTHSLEGQSYNEARAKFAVRMSGITAESHGYRPIDGSALMDIESTECTGQVEWGVVERPELAKRMKLTEMSRTSGASSRPAGRANEEDLPEVALLVDVDLRRRLGGAVGDAGAVLAAVRRADTAAEKFVEALYPRFTNEGGRDEFAEAQ